jgi:hypothetical protein
MARSTGRSVRMIRAWRVLLVLMIIPNLFFAIAGALAGHVAFFSLAVILLLLGAAAFQTVVIGVMEARSGQRYPLAEPALRKITGRRKPDYELIAGLERECGMEPSGHAGSSACHLCETGRHAAGEMRSAPVHEFGTAAAALAGTGSLTAAVHPDGVAFAPAEHFAQLAKVGRYSCLSPCPICAERDFAAAIREQEARMRAMILAPKPDLGDLRGDLARDLRDLHDLDDADVKQWLGRDRWEQR